MAGVSAEVPEVLAALARAAVPQVDRPLKAKEVGQVGTFRRVCRLRLGLPAEDQVAAALAQPPLAWVAPVPPPMGRMLNLKEHADQIDAL